MFLTNKQSCINTDTNSTNRHTKHFASHFETKLSSQKQFQLQRLKARLEGKKIILLGSIKPVTKLINQRSLIEFKKQALSIKNNCTVSMSSDSNKFRFVWLKGVGKSEVLRRPKLCITPNELKT